MSRRKKSPDWKNLGSPCCGAETFKKAGLRVCGKCGGHIETVHHGAPRAGIVGHGSKAAFAVDDADNLPLPDWPGRMDRRLDFK